MQIKAWACELPSTHKLQLSRWSTSDLVREVREAGLVASINSNFNQRALLWEDAGKTPINLNSLVPADSPWYLLSPGGINQSGEIAATALNLDTSEAHAVLLTPINGREPAARGTTKPTVLPAHLRRHIQQGSRY